MFAYFIKFWKKHIREAVLMGTTVLLSTASVFCLLLVMRSVKQERFLTSLKRYGNYDCMVNYISEEAGELLREFPGVTEFGAYYDLGKAVFGKTDGEELGVRAGCYADRTSEKIFYFPCDEGCYPQNGDEVAVDYMTALEMGVYPVVGEEIYVSLYDNGGNLAVSGKYTISGIYRMRSKDSYNANAYSFQFRRSAGRAVSPGMENDTYTCPVIMFGKECSNLVEDKKISCFWQARIGETKVGEEYAANIKNYLEQHIELDDKDADMILGAYWIIENTRTGRASAYWDISGDGSQMTYNGISSDDDRISMDKVARGEYKDMDKYSRYLIPVLLVCFVAIIFISVYSIQLRVVKMRSEQFKIMRRLGLQRYKLLMYSFAETLLLYVCLYLPGVLLGTGAYEMFLLLGRAFVSGGFVSALGADRYIKMLTYNPWLWAGAIPAVAGFAAMLYGMAGELKKYPQKRRVSAKKIARSGHLYRGKSCAHIYNGAAGWSAGGRKIGLLVLLAVSIGGLFFGYRFMLEKNNYENDFDYWLSDDMSMFSDYVLTDTGASCDIYGVESGQSNGFGEEDIDAIVGNEALDGIFAVAVRNSSRFVSDGKINGKLEKLPTKYSMVNNYEEDSDEEAGMRKAYEEMGFKDFDGMYNAPTIAVRSSKIELEELLADSKVFGEFDGAALENGEEIAIIWNGGETLAGDYFAVGDELTVSDVEIYPEADRLGFDSAEIYERFEPVYSVVDDSGEYIYASFCFGKRKDYKARIQSVIIPSERLKEELNIDEENGIYILTTLPALKKNGIGNTAYKKVCVKLNYKAAVDEFGRSLIEKACARGMSVQDITANVDDARQAKKYINAQFAVTFILFAVMGINAFFGAMRMDIIRQSANIAAMRAMGLDRKSTSRLLIGQFVSLPFIGMLAGILPVLGFQIYLNAIERRREAKLDFLTSWEYEKIPYSYKLFSDNWWSVLAVIVAVYVLLTVLVAVAETHKSDKYLTFGELRDE